MADYELAHAAEWDPDARISSTAFEASEDWQGVAAKRRTPVQHQTPKAQPSKDAHYQSALRKSIGVHQRQASKANAHTSPRKWHSSTNARRLPQRLPPPKLIDSSDNNGEAAWRARARQTDEIRIPECLILPADKGQPEHHHEEIAARYGAFLFSKHKHGNNGSKTYGLWGEPGAVAQAKTALRKWIEDVTSGKKSEASARFAKVVSLTPPLRERAEKRWAREVRRQTFRQHPPHDMAFGAIGSFLWPVEEWKPEEVLGASYEALDPIRMDCSCYVVFAPERGIFRVMGKASEVKLGLQRLRQTCFQVAARQIAPVRKYLLRWARPMVPLYVYLTRYERPAILSRGEALAEMSAQSPRGDDDMEDNERSKNAIADTRMNTELLRSILFRLLSKLHYYHGSIQMRIRLGTFLFEQYRAPKDELYDLDEYEAMIQQSQFQGTVTQE